MDWVAHRALQGWFSATHATTTIVGNATTIGKTYDEYVNHMPLISAAERVDPTPVLTMIGMVMSGHLQRNSTLRWRVVSDLTLASADDLGVLYPVDSVAKVWSTRQCRWLSSFAAEVLSQIKAVES